MLLLAAFLAFSPPTPAAADTPPWTIIPHVEQSGGGGGPITSHAWSDFGIDYLTWSMQTETWVGGATTASCSIGTKTGNSCVHQCYVGPLTDSCDATGVTVGNTYYYGYWTNYGKFWWIDGGGAYHYFTQLARTDYYTPPPHHTPILCPQDGPYYCGASPIVIPITPGPVKLSSPEVAFDIDGDGTVETVAWPIDTDRVAFLAIDENGNGMIDNGRELFGNATRPGSMTGFDALGQIAFVEDGDRMFGELTSQNRVFSKLLLWNDRNRNGVSEPDELRPASDVLYAIGLGYTQTGRKDPDGNEYRFKGFARFKGQNGESVERPIYDVYLAKLQ